MVFLVMGKLRLQPQGSNAEPVTDLDSLADPALLIPGIGGIRNHQRSDVFLLFAGWFPKYVDQSGAPNQQGLFRGLAATWFQGFQGEVLRGCGFEGGNCRTAGSF